MFWTSVSFLCSSWNPEGKGVQIMQFRATSLLGHKAKWGREEWKVDLGWGTQKLLGRGKTIVPIVIYSLWTNMVTVPSYFSKQAQTILLIIHGRITTCVSDSKLSIFLFLNQRGNKTPKRTQVIMATGKEIHLPQKILP